MQKQELISILSEILPNVTDRDLQKRLEKFIIELETPDGQNKDDPAGPVSSSKARKFVDLVSETFLKSALTEVAKEVIEKLIDML